MDKRQAIIVEIPKLRRFARALTGNAAAADDLVQDCLERALGRLHLWRANSDMRAWLFTILCNLHGNQRRRSARRGHEISLDAIAEPPGEMTPGPEQGLLLRDLERALDKLPGPQREVLLLVGLEQMSYAEAAKILDVPTGTVMSRLARGRDALDKLMNSDDTGNKTPLRRVK